MIATVAGWLLSHKVAVDPRVSKLHQTYYYLDLLEQLLGRARTAQGLEPKPPSQFAAEAMPDITLAVSPERKHAARIRLQSQGVDFNRTVVGVNPGAFYGSAKRWLSERYATVLDRLIDERRASVVIFGSPNEVAIAEAIHSGMRKRPSDSFGTDRIERVDRHDRLLRPVSHQRFRTDASRRRAACPDAGDFRLD